MLDWVKANRLKAASGSALLGDVFMGLAGGIGLFNLSFDGPAYTSLTIGGCLGITGHIALLLWGKGAKSSGSGVQTPVKTMSIFLKPAMPWRYPLDFGFLLFILANILYIAAGLYLHNYALCLSGVFAACASAIGWLWPHERPIFRLRSMQVTSLCFSMASLSHLIAAFLAMNLFILLSAVFYLTCNIILFTVRKENQSAYTQTHQTE